MAGWIMDNWEKLLTFIVTVLGAAWVAARRFTGRVSDLESRMTALEDRVNSLAKDQTDMETTIMGTLDKIERRFGEVLDLKIFVERQDVLLKTIHEDLRDLRDDVKRLMRDG